MFKLWSDYHVYVSTIYGALCQRRIVTDHEERQLLEMFELGNGAGERERKIMRRKRVRNNAISQQNKKKTKQDKTKTFASVLPVTVILIASFGLRLRNFFGTACSG